MTDLNLLSLPTKNTPKSSQQTDLFESVRAFVLKPMRKVIRGNKMRTLASKSIRIQKTLGKIAIDNNQKVTWCIFLLPAFKSTSE